MCLSSDRYFLEIQTETQIWFTFQARIMNTCSGYVCIIWQFTKRKDFLSSIKVPYAIEDHILSEGGIDQWPPGNQNPLQVILDL